MTKKDIEIFLNNQNFDLRKSGNGRWIDQKCTLDVVSIVAKCIMEYEPALKDEFFSSKDIQFSDYAISATNDVFNKPNSNKIEAANEYDKFFQQPMEMLSYAMVLEKQKDGNKNIYKIKNSEILEYISWSDFNAILFLTAYIKKVLTDSGIWFFFDEFLKNPNHLNFEKLKNEYTNFIIKHTKINGRLECHRIFIKVLNPLAYENKVFGTSKGKLSKRIIDIESLRYNKLNFRDEYSNKPKEISRKVYDLNRPLIVNKRVLSYRSSRAKDNLRKFNKKFNNSLTEFYQENHMNDLATEMHHIFPESGYPSICDYQENLIALTPTQHMNYAHPNRNTSLIDLKYQKDFLIAKIKLIKNFLENEPLEDFYSFDRLKIVLSVGFGKEQILDIKDNDFESLFKEIDIYYAAINQREVSVNYSPKNNKTKN